MGLFHSATILTNILHCIRPAQFACKHTKLRPYAHRSFFTFHLSFTITAFNTRLYTISRRKKKCFNMWYKTPSSTVMKSFVVAKKKKHFFPLLLSSSFLYLSFCWLHKFCFRNAITVQKKNACEKVYAKKNIHSIELKWPNDRIEDDSCHWCMWNAIDVDVFRRMSIPSFWISAMQNSIWDNTTTIIMKKNI